MSSTPAKRPVSDSGTPDPKRSKTDNAKGDKKPKGLNAEQELQMSLLNSDPQLKAHFTETVIKNRPEGVPMKSMARQFWAGRGHLLRAHAIQKEQQRAERYALSEKRLGPPKEGKVDVIMDQRQISDIFRQHPIVRKAFDELVPGRIKTPNDFWSRFWSSHLCCAIKGERPNPELTKKDAELDRYLTQFNSTRQEAEEARLAAQTGGEEEGVAPDEQMVPRFIDLEGNEQNHSQRKGNAPDVMMRPKETREGTIRILNTMSERILAASTPADDISTPKDQRAQKGKQHNPAGMDEATYNQLRLRDLQIDETDDRVKLNIRDPNQIHAAAAAGSADGDASVSADAKTYLRIDPTKALSVLRKDMSSAAKSSGLDEAIGFTEDSDDDDDDEDDRTGSKKKTQTLKVGSHAALAAASKQVTRLLEQQQHMLAPAEDKGTTIQAGLSATTAANVLQVHHTTVEFLHFFWTLLLGVPAGQEVTGSAARELPALLESLSNSLARITSVAGEAEAERRARLAALQQQAHEAVQRSEGRRRVQVREEQAGPGGEAVRALLGPAVLAVQAARARFEQAVTVGVSSGGAAASASGVAGGAAAR